MITFLFYMEQLYLSLFCDVFVRGYDRRYLVEAYQIFDAFCFMAHVQIGHNRTPYL